MQNKKATVLSATTLVILLGLAGFYVYNDMKSRGGATTQTSGEAKNTATSTEPAYTIKELPVDNPVPAAPMPDLSRQTVFKADVSPEAQKILAANIANLITDLKANNSDFGKWLTLGTQWKIAGDYEGAKQVWSYAATLGSESYIPWYNLGDLYMHYLSDYPKAADAFNNALQRNPTLIDGYRALYELYRDLYTQKASLAPQVLKDGLAKNPKSTDLMVLLAQYYKESGDKTQALSYYNQALAEAQAEKNASLANLVNQEIQNLNP